MGILEIGIVIFIVMQVVGIVYWVSVAEKFSWRKITVGNLIMIFIAPCGLLFVVLLILFYLLCSIVYEIASPILNKRIFK